MDSTSDDPHGGARPRDARRANRERAVAAAEALADAGLPVRVIEEGSEVGADGGRRGWTDDPYDTRNQNGPDPAPPPPGVRIAIVEVRVAGEDPFDGVRVEWLAAPRVGRRRPTRCST